MNKSLITHKVYNICCVHNYKKSFLCFIMCSFLLVFNSKDKIVNVMTVEYILMKAK